MMAGGLTRRRIVGTLSGALLLPAVARATDSSPLASVDAIYRRASAGRGNDGGQFLWLDPAIRRTRFTARTADLWARADRATAAGDAGPVGFDPVTASQDPNLKSFELRLEQERPDHASILVALTGHGERKPYASLRYHLVRERGRWLIDDIASARGSGADAWSLRKLLEDHLKAARRS